MFQFPPKTLNCDLSRRPQSVRRSAALAVECSKTVGRLGHEAELAISETVRIAATGSDVLVMFASLKLLVCRDEAATVASEAVERRVAVSLRTEGRSVASDRFVVELEFVLAIEFVPEQWANGKLAVEGTDTAVAVDIAVGKVGFSGSIGIRCRFERSIDKALSRSFLMMDYKLIAFDRLDWSLLVASLIEPSS